MMIIRKFLTVRFPSNEGPDLYGIATLTERHTHVSMKNGRNIPWQDMIFNLEFNPGGLIERDELVSLYSDERILGEGSPIPIKLKDYFRKSQSDDYYSHSELIALIQAAIINPVDIMDICDKDRRIAFYTLYQQSSHSSEFKPSSDIASHWKNMKETRKHTFKELFLVGHYIWEGQRGIAEKDFYVIKPWSKYWSNRYVAGFKRDRIAIKEGIKAAKQFITEDELFSYIEEHVMVLGETGYEIEKIQGMNMEEGFAV